MSYKIPKGLKYSKDHEWVKVEGKVAVIGITDFAVKELTDVTYVEVEDVEEIQVNDVFGTVESTKTASDLICPVSGKLKGKNDKLSDKPELLNEDCYANWIIKVDTTNLTKDLAAMLDDVQYAKFIKELKE